MYEKEYFTFEGGFFHMGCCLEVIKEKSFIYHCKLGGQESISLARVKFLIGLPLHPYLGSILDNKEGVTLAVMEKVKCARVLDNRNTCS